LIADSRDLAVPKKKRCRKLPYKTRADAQAAIAEMIRKHPSIVYKKVYRCGVCKAWHITSTPRGGAPRRVKH
jgi:hypothetical protein